MRALLEDDGRKALLDGSNYKLLLILFLPWQQSLPVRSNSRCYDNGRVACGIVRLLKCGSQSIHMSSPQLKYELYL